MLPQWIIEKKRDGGALSRQEIEWLVRSYVQGSLPDYQMSAFAMAVYFKGMTWEETSVLTDAMMRSGDVVDTSSIRLPKADKHSTGGIGDKVSLILAPLIACCGLAVPMISGRGLGITGGTLDKLEAIPGYRTDLSERELLEVVGACGCSITGQTGQLAPADRKLYALRDVTGTVPSIPLIVSSIMCKKLAEGIDALVLDVKHGKGAFMRELEDARELARGMVQVGRAHGKSVSAIITDMNQPLGRTVGNGLEVWEAVRVLSGEPVEDLLEVTLALGTRLLEISLPAAQHCGARAMLEGHIRSGAALKKFREMVALQGGDLRVVDEPERLFRASIVRKLDSPAAGYVRAVDPEIVGKACILLGAGRSTVKDTIDHAVGLSGLLKEGEKVEKGAPLATIHANDPEKLAQALPMLAQAFEIGGAPAPVRALIVESI